MLARGVGAVVIAGCAAVGLALASCESGAGVRSPRQSGPSDLPAPVSPRVGNQGAVGQVPSLPNLPPLPAREMRAVWVATVANIDWPSSRTLTFAQQVTEMDAILDTAARTGLNAVVLQVRPSCDAIYTSDLEPWSEFLTGAQGQPVRGAPADYDPLKRWIDGAHARGLQLHAWFNPFRARHPDARQPDAPLHVSRTKAGVVRTYGQYAWLDPGEAEAREHSLRVILDVVRRYDIDGVHMDDYFYPYPVAGQEFPDAATYAAYTRTMQAQGRAALSRADWRRQNINAFVRDLSVRVHAEKPWLAVGISPFGIWRPNHPAGVKGLDAYEALSADARLWLTEGLVDYCTPQLYWAIEAPQQPFEPLLRWWRSQSAASGYGRPVWPGLNVSRVGSGEGADRAWPADQIVRQVTMERALRGSGEAGSGGGVFLYSMKPLLQNRGGVREAVMNVLGGDVLPPLYPWLAGERPLLGPPRVTVGTGPGGVASIGPPAGAPASSVQGYAVFVQRSPGSPWTFALLPRTATSVPGASGTPARVAAACVDRFGRVGAWVSAGSP